jgi:hypothetical protein
VLATGWPPCPTPPVHQPLSVPVSKPPLTTPAPEQPLGAGVFVEVAVAGTGVLVRVLVAGTGVLVLVLVATAGGVFVAVGGTTGVSVPVGGTDVGVAVGPPIELLRGLGDPAEKSVLLLPVYATRWSDVVALIVGAGPLPS